ncbi:MAG: hypothetical protein OEW94_14065 [Betaproteobacteria bacterium]|nr:hypothetical protein [Betaproteobacteria bacterium]MDH5352428.1 hypothetical protein [Betaproteobacteria bacterium]
MWFWEFMAKWGIWDIIGLFVALIPSVLVVVYLFPRNAIDNFYIDTRLASVNEVYKRVISVELRNHTNDPIYVLSLGFTFGTSVRPSPHGKKHAATGTYEIKFQGRVEGQLSEIDTLVRPNQVVTTWIPIAADQTDAVLEQAVRERKVGVLRLKVQKISSRPHPFSTLRIPI